MKLILRTLALVTALIAVPFALSAPPTTGQFLFQRKPSTGPFDQFGVTPVTGQVFGWNGSNVVMLPNSGGGGVWGSITGTLSNQTDLQNVLNLTAPLASPAFTTQISFTSEGQTYTIEDGINTGGDFAQHGLLIKATLPSAVTLATQNFDPTGYPGLGLVDENGNLRTTYGYGNANSGPAFRGRAGIEVSTTGAHAPDFGFFVTDISHGTSPAWMIRPSVEIEDHYWPNQFYKPTAGDIQRITFVTGDISTGIPKYQIAHLADNTLMLFPDGGSNGVKINSSGNVVMGGTVVIGAGSPITSSGAGGIMGTVTSIPDGATNGVTWTVANRTTIPAFTFSLGNITPTSVVSSGPISGAQAGDTAVSGIATGGGDGVFASSDSGNGLNASTDTGIAIAGYTGTSGERLRIGNGNSSTDTVINYAGGLTTASLNSRSNTITFGAYGITANSSGTLATLGTFAAPPDIGTGTPGAGAFTSLTIAGNFLATTDNTYDIGASGANRPRSLYLGGNVDVSSGQIKGGLLRSATGLIIDGGTIDTNAPGNLLLRNNSNTTFGMIQLGDTTSSFPAIKRNAAGLEARLADDSGYTTVRASNFVGSGAAISGNFSATGTATTAFVVTIGTTMANNTYEVSMTPTSLVAAAVFYVSAKTTTTFTITYLAGLTGTVSCDWEVFP